jgi:hypothetical protein
MTNKGLRMELLLNPKCHEQIFEVPLNCAQRDKTVCLNMGKSNLAYPGFDRTWYLGLVNITDKYKYSKRAVLFTKQRDPDWLAPHLLSEKRKEPYHFVLRSDSLLKHGFRVLEKRTTHYPPPSEKATIHIERRPIQDPGERAGRFTVESLYKVPVALLNFWNWNSDGFVLLLWEADEAWNYEDEIAVSIFIPEQQQSLAQLHHTLVEEVSRTCHQNPDVTSQLDRISRRMKSGKSVSVALRRGVDSGKLSYFLDIDIDPDGKLPWPGLYVETESETESEEEGIESSHSSFLLDFFGMA